MKDFVPVDEEFSATEEFRATIHAAKQTIIDAVEASDKSKFDSTEIGLMKELTEIITKTKGIDFGNEYDKILEKLLNSIKNRKAKIEQTLAQQNRIAPQIKTKLRF